MTKLRELGGLVAQEQDQARANHARDPLAAERFARKVSRSSQRWRVRAGVSAVVVTAAAASVVLGISRSGHRADPTADAATPAVGDHFVTGAGQTLPLGFPDGSQVVIGSGSAAVVQELSPTGAKVEVSRGSASFAVRHQQRTNWLVGAGPYHVRVTGTRFTVAWAPGPERFELRLEQGSVVVTTDTGSHAAVTMLAPQSLVIEQGAWTLASPTQAAEPEEAPPAVTPERPPAAPSGSAREPVSPARRPQTSAWEGLARAGRYGDAYDDAAHAGIGRLAETRPSHALLALAEVCRFSGHASEATRVLGRLRTRFPGADDAATAAFQLGREADDASAATWFRTYLKERPNGSLAPEASGRLLEALSRSGDREGAKSAATSYLARYPSGVHAAFARQLLDR
jgi:ferric-dicitrate binding protein FerR (iron transport regulator)